MKDPAISYDTIITGGGRASLKAEGVQRLFTRITGVRQGKPSSADDQLLDVANVIWRTGFLHEHHRHLEF